MASKPQPAPAEPAITDETRSVASLLEDPRNARQHSAGQIAQIVASIERFGFVDKLVIRPDGQLIGGHARLAALKIIGAEQVECRVVAGFTEPQYQALAIALNRIPENSAWNEDVLREVLGELQDMGESPLALGFSPAELDKLLKEPDELEVKEIETGPVNDECWISIRAPLAVQAQLMKAVEEATKSIKDVTIDLGTINIG